MEPITVALIVGGGYLWCRGRNRRKIEEVSMHCRQLIHHRQCLEEANRTVAMATIGLQEQAISMEKAVEVLNACYQQARGINAYWLVHSDCFRYVDEREPLHLEFEGLLQDFSETEKYFHNLLCIARGQEAAD